MKKVSKNLPVGRNKKHITKKGSSTQKPKKTRSVTRYFEVKIRIPAEDYARGISYFDDQKYLPKFCMDAFLEKVNRAESNNKSARLRTLMGNVELLESVLIEMKKQGKLDFLREENNGKTRET